MKYDNLVIVESKAKSDIIKKYLNSIDELKKFGTFNVIPCYGHIRDLDKKNKGIDINNNFKATYKLIQKDGATKVIKNLEQNIKNCKTVWLAADLDREGESIAWHIKEFFNLKNYKRIVFNEITKEALKTSVLNPRNIDMNLVNAQQARRFLDRIVGFEITPLLWNKFNTNITLSAGRVQSATLNIIINKENEINKHNSISYYTALGNFNIDNYKIDDAKYEVNEKIYKFSSNNEALIFLKKLKSKYYLEDIKSSSRTQKPPNPFITSTLQQVASGELKMSIKQVMAVAQTLYESGLITYMRTDSYNLSNDILSSIEKFIKSKYGNNYYLGSKTRKKSKNSQEAHEAIRPSKITKLPSDLSITSKIKKEHIKLYELIWKRTVASQMQPSKYYDISLCIKNEIFKNNQCFVGKFKIYFFDGYLVLYSQKVEQNFDINKYIQNISALKNKLKMTSINAKNTWSVPPTRFSESSIVKILEKNGIGRPSTYSSILSKLYEKRYIEKKDVLGELKEYINYTLFPNKKIKNESVKKNIIDEKSKLVPSEIGFEINKYMEENFKTIIDTEFTSNIEANLDKIADGNKTLLNIMNPFYKDFSKLVNSASNKNKSNVNKGKSKIKLETYSQNFKIKNNMYTVRIAKYGPVIQYTDPTNKEKNKFISLVPYLKTTNKEIENIDKKDIKLLLSLPKIIGKYNNKDVELLYARYGFYLKCNGMNSSIFKQYQKHILNNNYDEIIKLINDKTIVFK